MAKKKTKDSPISIPPAHSATNFCEKFETKTYWQLLIIVIIPSLVYLKVINFDYVDFDDRIIIADHYNIIGNIKNIGEIFKRDALLSVNGNSFYRPVQGISFMLDALISGQNLWMYHLSNLLIHLLTCVTLYYFLKQLNFRNLVAFAFTLLFSVHPLFASAISWIPSRGDLLIGLFGLLLFISFYKHLISGKRIYFFFHAVLFLLAAFTKETAILFPLPLLFYYFFVVNQSIDIKKLIPYFSVWTIVLVFYLIVRNNIISPNPYEHIGIYVLINSLAVIPITICKFFIPYNLSTFPLFESFATIAGTLLFLSLFYLILKYTNRKNTTLLFGIVWFFVFTLPGLYVSVPQAEYRFLYLEHRTYLTMIGIIILLAYFFNTLLNEKKIQARVFAGAAVIIILLFAFLASAHSDDYKDSIAFLNKAISFNNPNGYVLRGDMYVSLHDSAEASDDFNHAIQLAPNYAFAYIDRGKFEGDILQQHTISEKDFTKAISLDSTFTDSWIKRAVERIHLQDYNGATNDLNKAMQLDSNSSEVYFRFGDLYFHQKKYQEAFYNLTKAITLQPRLADAYMNRGTLRYVMNDLQGAIIDYKKAIEIKPLFLSYYNLGVVYNDLHQPDEAITLFDSCINIAPNFTAAYMAKGKSLQQKNNITEACKDWQQALNLGDATAKDTLKKYCK